MDLLSNLEDRFTIRLTFKGMYAWHTAANYALWLLMMDLCYALAFRFRGAYNRCTVAHIWGILIVTYVAGFISQRTIVYQLVSLYSPAIIYIQKLNPTQRPGIVPMFLFMLPFWLIIGYLLVRMILSMPLKTIAARLPDDWFVQIHRSHIVNLDWISGVKRNGRQVHMTLKHRHAELPVSRYRLPQLLPVIERFLNPGNATAVSATPN